MITVYMQIMQYVNICHFPLGDNKVRILTHIWPHKPLRKIQVAICNHQADSPLEGGLVSDLMILQVEGMCPILCEVVIETRHR